MIAIIDYGGGNVQSVKNALDRLGVFSLITDDKEIILKADKVIFPGQGHFGACMKALREKGLYDVVREVALTKPFLGICIGMQLLFERSEEAPGIQGLGVLKGEVKKFDAGQKIPQMGWNSVTGALKGSYYFANSYFCVPETNDCIVAMGEYGQPFVAAVQKGNLLAVQFHPEKSGQEGMRLLESFARGLIFEASQRASYTQVSKRVIPCLDVKDGQVVKGTRFIDLKQAGDPVVLAKYYESEGADELVLLDITATVEKRIPFTDIVARVAKELSIPFSVGGGIRTVADIRNLLNAGADKVSLNSAALANPQLIADAASAFGSQCIILAMDVKRTSSGWEVVSHSGTLPTGRDAIAWAMEAQDLGAGELLVTSIDRDGTGAGYDLELLQTLQRYLKIPIIASGGVGKWEDIRDAFMKGRADAALAASLFHFGKCSIPQLKEFLSQEKIGVRL